MPILQNPAPPHAKLPGLHLYHFGMSNCSQRVRILLEEKALAWISHPINLPRDEHTTPQYLAINPCGLVQTLVHDGRAVIESLDIMDYLETSLSTTRFEPKPGYRARCDEVCATAGTSQWLAGSRFSTADITWMPNLRRMELMRSPLAPYPALRNWVARVECRPSYLRALQHYESAWLRYGMGAYTLLRGLRGTGVAAHLPHQP